MQDQLDKRLLDLQRRLAHRESLESQIRRLENILGDARAKARRLVEKVEKEKADVERIKGLTPASIFHSLLGAKDSKVEQEKREWLAAKLNHDEAIEAVDEAQCELGRLQLELEQIGEVHSEYRSALKLKEQQIYASGDVAASKLAAIAKAITRLEAEQTQLEEVIRAGGVALEQLDRVAILLVSADKYGVLDMMGGGWWVTMSKYSRLDSARYAANRAQRLLRKFQAELADVGERLHLSLEISSLTRFADYFFDNFVTDYMVQTKISDASRTCSSTRQQVAFAVKRCRTQLDEVKANLAQAITERQSIIVGS